MTDIDRFFDHIDGCRVRRVRELLDIKSTFAAAPSPLFSKAAIVLTYANWEGFYNECTVAYVEFLSGQGRQVRQTGWTMLTGAFESIFESLRARNHSPEAKLEFVSEIEGRLDCKFDAFDASVIKARSNLDFYRLQHNYSLLQFDITPFQRYRLRIDKELVGWRHSVAHGDAPDLSALDASKHVELAEGLLVLMSDHFQSAMLRHL